MTHSVDFLVVAALAEEAEAVIQMLDNVEKIPYGRKGTINITDSEAKHDVAVTVVGVGSNEAQAGTTEAILNFHPKYVILVGIAAGFPEHEIFYGDIMIPMEVVYYEFGKQRMGKDGAIEFEHRGHPEKTSKVLHRIAAGLAVDETAPWVGSIKEERPEGGAKNPVVSCEKFSLLGCGEKIVATEGSTERNWLLKQRAMGLEMESWGVAKACGMSDTPFLVVKASQDPATGEKDRSDVKDLWRPYSMQAAAAFTRHIISNVPAKHFTEASEYIDRSYEILDYIKQTEPNITFPYTVCLADTFQLIKMGQDCQEGDINILIPNDLQTTILLHGGGGAGKSQIIRTLFGLILKKGFCPVLIDLKKYAKTPKVEEAPDQVEPEKILQDILAFGSAPKLSLDELKGLTQQVQVVALVDGLNEIPDEIAYILIDALRDLQRHGKCYQVFTERYSSHGVDIFTHALVKDMDLQMVEKMFNDQFGPDSFGKLNTKLKTIYQKPFFLSLALKTHEKFSESHLQSGIFEDFFRSRLGFSSDELDMAAVAAFNSFKHDGSIDRKILRDKLDSKTYDRMTEAHILIDGLEVFEHDLWREYLISRYFANNPAEWNESGFDKVTTFNSSHESLIMAIEQLHEKEQVEEILKKIFDWNYGAAVHCIAELNEDIPQAIRVAILAAIAEKRFDDIEHTKRRAEANLKNMKSEFVKRFVEVETRKELADYVNNFTDEADWFLKWKDLFKNDGSNEVTVEIVGLIESEDPILGWTTANLVRRGKAFIDIRKQEFIRDLYHAANDSDRGSVRWRVVHVLGGFPNKENADLLFDALEHDKYNWVKYGAARALIECAAKVDNDLREYIITNLIQLIKKGITVKPIMRHHILREIMEASFIDNPEEGWQDAVMPLLQCVSEAETDPDLHKSLIGRIEDFKGR